MWKNGTHTGKITLTTTWFNIKYIIALFVKFHSGFEKDKVLTPGYLVELQDMSTKLFHSLTCNDT